jgi:hypothetical protein
MVYHIPLGYMRGNIGAVQISGWVEPVVLMLLDKRVPQPRQAKSGWGEGMVHLGALPRKDLREPQGALQIPPLRYASVGMTRGEGLLRLEWLRDGFSKNISKNEPPNRRSLPRP